MSHSRVRVLSLSLAFSHVSLDVLLRVLSCLVSSRAPCPLELRVFSSRTSSRTSPTSLASRIVEPTRLRLHSICRVGTSGLHRLSSPPPSYRPPTSRRTARDPLRRPLCSRLADFLVLAPGGLLSSVASPSAAPRLPRVSHPYCSQTDDQLHGRTPLVGRLLVRSPGPSRRSTPLGSPSTAILASSPSGKRLLLTYLSTFGTWTTFAQPADLLTHFGEGSVQLADHLGDLRRAPRPDRTRGGGPRVLPSSSPTSPRLLPHTPTYCSVGVPIDRHALLPDHLHRVVEPLAHASLAAATCPTSTLPPLFDVCQPPRQLPPGQQLSRCWPAVAGSASCRVSLGVSRSARHP